MKLNEKEIRLQDVQSLLLWILGEGSNPRWAFVQVPTNTTQRLLQPATAPSPQNKPLVRTVVLLMAHGLDANTLQQHADTMLFLNSMREHTIECVNANAGAPPGGL